MTNTTRGSAVVLALGLAIGAGGCTGTPGSDPVPPDTAGTPQLVAFDSCRQALSELKTAARPYVGAYGFQFGGVDRLEGDAAAAAPDSRAAAPDAAGAGKSAPEHSGTNTHEAGVDEPDLVKTDGERIVTVTEGVLRVVDVSAREQTGRLALETSGNAGAADSQLLLYGDRALVVLRGAVPLDRPAVAPEESPTYPVAGTEVLLVDLSGGPEVVSRMRLDGEYVDARMVGDQVRLVTRAVPRLPFTHPDRKRSPARTARDNKIILDDSRIDDWLPRYEIETGHRITSGRVGCGQVSRPAGYSATSMLTVISVGMRAEALSGERSVSIVADGRTVYGTGRHLYVANDQRAVMPLERDPGAPDRSRKPRTEIYKFDVSAAGAPRHVASGAVPGWLLNQYAMSEYDNHLRVATTNGEQWAGGAEDAPRTESAVYVLAHEGTKLTTVGEAGGLGKGEQIYSVRFVGPVGYVVTFRQVDPLYVLDLRDPERPRATGELKITGYSAYLHPAGNGWLIGVGQEASTEGRRLGLQVSLFDVSDPTAPSRLARHHIRDADSAAEFEPHAFLYWPKTGLLVVPVTSHRAAPADDGSAYGGALVLKVSDGSLTEVGTVAHPGTEHTATVQRSLVIGETLWTVSSAGLQANDGATLKERAWIPFE